MSPQPAHNCNVALLITFGELSKKGSGTPYPHNRDEDPNNDRLRSYDALNPKP